MLYMVVHTTTLALKSLRQDDPGVHWIVSLAQVLSFRPIGVLVSKEIDT